jgi:hypothetical protein
LMYDLIIPLGEVGKRDFEPEQNSCNRSRSLEVSSACYAVR